jgi:Sigma-70 region 2
MVRRLGVEESCASVPGVLGDPLLNVAPVAGRRPQRTRRGGFDSNQVRPGEHMPDLEAVVDGLYREHQRRLVQLAAAITLDRAVAEEVVHDVFASFYGHVSTVEEPAGYLHRAVVQRSISVLRRRRVAARHPRPVAAVTVTPEIDETWRR